MDLIVETDLGRDPDDLFALCYLIGAGVNIRAIVITPGDPDQIQIARMICDTAGLKIPIGASVANRDKSSSGGMHYTLLNKKNYSLRSTPDGFGEDIIKATIQQFPQSELFAIGPVTSIGNYLKNSKQKITRATMQGGFLSYRQYQPEITLSKFNFKESMDTFNLNGDREAGLAFLSADIEVRQMVGKNVCHTFLFTPEKLKRIKPQTPIQCLFVEAAEIYFDKHSDKKFHDPTAACLHLHPEIATWYRGRTTKMNTGWGTQDDPNGDYICADVNHGKLWDYILSFQ